MNPLLEHAAQHNVRAVDIVNATSARTLWVRSTTPGGADGTHWWESDARGITYRESPHGPGFVSWAEIYAEIYAVIERGRDDVLMERARAAYRRYVDVATEDPESWRQWPTKKSHRTRLDAHQRRYREVSDELRRVEQRVVTHGLAVRGQLALW